MDDSVQCELERFQGPALMSFNNAPFKKEDWKNIQKLHDSGKAKDPHKVGKFGIGFNSVYHITGKSVSPELSWYFYNWNASSNIFVL